MAKKSKDAEAVKAAWGVPPSEPEETAVETSTPEETPAVAEKAPKPASDVIPTLEFAQSGWCDALDKGYRKGYYRPATKEEYKASNSPTINHFYEKLLLLKDKMNTKTGKRIATERHKFMELYLEQFYAEWDGKR